MELFAQNGGGIRRLSYCNENRTHNHLVPKRTLNHLVKLVECLFTERGFVGTSPVAVT